LTICHSKEIWSNKPSQYWNILHKKDEHGHVQSKWIQSKNFQLRSLNFGYSFYRLYSNQQWWGINTIITRFCNNPTPTPFLHFSEYFKAKIPTKMKKGDHRISWNKFLCTIAKKNIESTADITQLIHTGSGIIRATAYEIKRQKEAYISSFNEIEASIFVISFLTFSCGLVLTQQWSSECTFWFQKRAMILVYE